jgi:hypothetical protein
MARRTIMRSEKEDVAAPRLTRLVWVRFYKHVAPTALERGQAWTGVDRLFSCITDAGCCGVLVRALLRIEIRAPGGGFKAERVGLTKMHGALGVVGYRLVSV